MTVYPLSPETTPHIVIVCEEYHTQHFSEFLKDKPVRYTFLDNDTVAEGVTHCLLSIFSDPEELALQTALISGEYPNTPILCTTAICTITELQTMVPEPLAMLVGCNWTPGITEQSTLIEICTSRATSPRAEASAVALMEHLGFGTHLIADRIAGVQLRTLAMLINEAFFASMEGVASQEDIERAMQLGVNYPRGLFQWAQSIGLATIVATLDALYYEYHQERYRVCVALRQAARDEQIS
jgi:hypothetical protein